MNKKFIFLLFIAISLFTLGVVLAIPYSYYGKWKDGLGTEPVVIISIAWAFGMGVLILGKVLKYKVPYREIGILIITIWISNSLIKSKKHENIKSNHGITYAKVLFKGSKYRHGFGIDYSYVINGKVYLKWDNDGDFIKKEKLNVGDSIEVAYNKKNPHMHEFNALLYK